MKKASYILNLILLVVILVLGSMLFHANAERDNKQPTGNEHGFFAPLGSLPYSALLIHSEASTGLASSALKESNPIDDVFDEYWLGVETTIEEGFMAGQYRQYWEAEMLHAFDLLETRSHPKIGGDKIKQVEKTVMQFASLNGELYADIIRSGAYEKADREFGSNISQGSGYPGTSLIAKAAFLREYTFYLYDMLAFLDISPDFIFNREDMEKEWAYLAE